MRLMSKLNTNVCVKSAMLLSVMSLYAGNLKSADCITGTLTEVYGEGLNTGGIQALASYECAGTCYVVSGGNPGATSNVVYEVDPSNGTLTEVYDHGLNAGVITALTSYECAGTCYVVSGGTSGATSNVVYEVNPDGTLTEVPYHGLNTDTLRALTSYECTGTCYVVSGGTDGEDSNVVYEVDPSDGTLTEVYGHGLNTGSIGALASYECAGICYVVSGGFSSATSNVVYEVDPNDGTLTPVSGHGLNTGMIQALTSYECAGTCYIVSGGPSFSDSSVVYEVETDGALTEVYGHGLSSGNISDLTAYECGGTCYLVSGGGSNGSSADEVYAVNPEDGTLTEVYGPGLNGGEIFALTSYECAGTFYVASGGFPGATPTNVVYEVCCGGSIDPCDPFPDLLVSGLGELVACRGEQFCYELTITNPVNMYQNEASGNITVTGLLDTDWTVTEVIDCSNGETSYTGPVGSVWTNPLDQNITFNETGTGTWTIGVLQPNTSICLKLCGTDPDVGNKTLNIEVTQTP